MLRKLLKDYDDKNRREHSFVLIVLNNLAGILQDQKKFDEAEKIFREVLSTRERVLGSSKPATVTSVNNLAFLLHQNKKDAEAKHLFLRALAQLSKQKGPRDLLTRNTRGNYGVSMMFGGTNEAEKSEGRRIVLQCLKALRASPHKLKDSHPWVVKFEHELKRDKMLRRRKEKKRKNRKQKVSAKANDASDSSSSSSSSSSSFSSEDEEEQEKEKNNDSDASY